MIARAITLGTVFAVAASLATTPSASATTRFEVTSRTGGATTITPVSSAPRRTFPNIAVGLSRLGARYLGPVSLGNKMLTFHVQTQMRNAAGLHAYAAAASRPGSLYYRHWLTPSTIASAFGTPQAQYVAAANYFKSLGMLVHPWQTRTSLTVTGNQRQIEAALGTKLGMFRLRNATFFAPSTAAALPATIAVAGFGGLTNAHVNNRTSMLGAPPITLPGGFANARVNGATPQMLASVYDLDEAYAKGYTGKGINLGIIGTGPIASADFPNFRKLFSIPGTSTVTQDVVSINGDTAPPATTGPCTGGTSEAPTATCNPEDEEAQLDTEQTAGLARDANVVFYLAYNAPNDEQGLGDADDELQQAVDDNKVDILSLSYGGCEILDSALFSLTPTPLGDATGTDPTLFSELASEGIATFVSSGDSGSAGCQRALEGAVDEPNASYPASDPNVVAVGGTTTPMGPDGRLTGPITNWGQQTKSGGAAGAGVSVDFQTPSYQKAQSSVSALCLMRCVPDVALDADPFTGAAVLYDSTAALGGPSEAPIGGTSQAAPDMAAVWAVVLSACEVSPKCLGPNVTATDPVSGFSPPSAVPRYRLGNPNYLLYPILANTAMYHSVFYDITYGNDGVPTTAAATIGGEAGTDPYVAGIAVGSVSAGPGYDEASGLGMPLGYQLIKYLVPGAK